MESSHYELNNEKVSKMYKAKYTMAVFLGITMNIMIVCTLCITIQKYNKLEFFVEDDIYWAPASTTAHLYSQLASKKYREIPINQLR